MRRERRIQQLLNAAARVFSRKGYHKASVSDIIQEAKVARGTFYLYFKSKRAIFDALLDNFFETIESQVERIQYTGNIDEAIGQLRNNVMRVIQLLTEQRHLTRILLSEAVGLDSEIDMKLIEFYNRLVSLIKRSMELGKQMGLVRNLNSDIAAILALGTVKEIMYQYIMKDQRFDINELVDEILGYVLFGIVTPEAFK